MSDDLKIHVDWSTIRPGNGVPPVKDTECPLCGGETESGYGLAYGGFGSYWTCLDCDWWHKVDEGDE